MPVFGEVGLQGSGKTRRMVKYGLEGLANGMDVYANFGIGVRVEGYVVPICEHVGCRGWDGELTDVHTTTRKRIGEKLIRAGVTWEFRKRTPVLDYYAKLWGWRAGRGFIPSDRVYVFEPEWGWEQLMALRVGRDPFGIPHRLRLVQDVETGEWFTSPMCGVYDCKGCSKGILVLLDEVHRWANSRKWQETAVDVFTRWSYARKDGMVIWWSAQHESRADKIIRELSDHIFTNNAMGGKIGPVRLQLFQRRRWVPAELTEKNRRVSGEGMRVGAVGGFEWPEFVVRFGKKLYTAEEDAYDTFEHIREPKQRGKRRVEREDMVRAEA